jgi:geranylgeranyl reductase family protein
MTSKNLAEYDTVVIGAGPAGSEMAYRLALAGFSVLVVEKDRLDREKPCGGGIQLKELIEFGPLPDDVVERRILKSRIISPENHVMEVPVSTDPGLYSVTVRRSAYDRYLQNRAVQEGVEMISETRATDVVRHGRVVTVRLDGPAGPWSVRTRLIVHAAGSNASKLTALLGMDPGGGELCVTCHHWLKPARMPSCFREATEFYYLRENPEGYAWIFPKGDVLSVGIGATAASVRRHHVRLPALLADFIAGHPLAAKKLAGASVVKTGGGVIRFGLLPRLWSPYAVALGDAGGFANIVHGGGIYHARKSAALAAPHCVEFLKTGSSQCLKRYDVEARDFFESNEGRWDRKIRKIFWMPRVVDRIVKNGAQDRQIQDAVRIVLNAPQSHADAYRILEGRLLKILYSELNRVARSGQTVVNAKLAKIFTGGNPLHAQANEILLSPHAKRLRAYIGMLAAGIFGGNRRDALNLAIIYEIFHTASLVHDDIMDNAKERRGKPTLHAKYGLGPAIIVGDLMLSRCYTLVGRAAVSRHISKTRLLALLQTIGETGENCCLGQMDDMEMARRRQYGSIEKYLHMVELKTGSLIEGAVKGGAIGAGAPPAMVVAIGRFGRALGMAFQIIDDLLDLLGGADANKSVMNDLAQGKATPMLIYSLRRARQAEKRAILRACGNPAITNAAASEVVDIYRRNGAIAYAQALSLQYVERARRELRRLPSGAARDEMNAIVDVLGLLGMLGQE